MSPWLTTLPGYNPVQVFPGNPPGTLPLGQMLLHIAVVRVHIGRNLRHPLPKERRERLQQPFHILPMRVLPFIIVNLAPPVVILHHMQVRMPFITCNRQMIPLRLPWIVLFPFSQIIRARIRVSFRPAFCVLKGAPVRRPAPRYLNPQRMPIIIPVRSKNIQQCPNFQQ